MRFFVPLLIAATLTASKPAAVQPIQAQGSAPYCLFAVAAYLTAGDLWELEQHYYRSGGRNWPGTTTPINSDVLTIAADLYDVEWMTTQDYATARGWVAQGYHVASSGQGHAVVLVAFSGGKYTYVDSLHAGQTFSRTESTQRAWSDGWYWRIK